MDRHCENNPPPGERPSGLACIHQRVRLQAHLTPDAIAVTFGNAGLTYRELDERSNQLAHRLRSLGVGPERLVAIGLERSLELVIGLLGILKAGGAYLPIDAAYPRDRIQFMVEDAAPVVLLTSPSMRSALPDTDLIALMLEPTWSELEGEPLDAPPDLVDSSNLAYVIYTSGSTGKPKGCQLTHGNVARLFTATEHWFGFDSSDVWTLFHSHAFDFSVWEIWGALVHGGRLVVVPYETTRAPDRMHGLMVREGVTVLNQTPTAFRGLMEADRLAGVPTSAMRLRHVIFAGEALELQMLRPWFERYGDQHPQLTNMYGITETTVHVTYRPIRLTDLESGVGSMIGEPIPDLELFVLDGERRPVAAGEVGEIHVAGPGVCLGYLNRPDLTAERFFDWHAPDGRELRVYRSGDLARPMADGDLQYIGRADHQVKIRGFRIEIGEIESTLARHPSVRACAIIARREEGEDEARLVAYVVPANEPCSQSVLRDFLARTLPDYMLPGAFVELPALPLTENGKLDRSALPAPLRSRPLLANAFEAPIGEFESRLCRLFADVLSLDEAGRNDNFFDLGGDSLRAAALARRISNIVPSTVGGVSTPLVFQHPTPAGLASALLEGREGRQSPGMRFARGSRAQATPEPIAIIAMAGRFPGAPDVETFWRNLCEGRDTITFFGPDELDPAVTDRERNDPDYVKARGIIDGVEMFDAGFFGISPKEAELMDPQQRIFLELAWECLERAGYVPDATPVPVGVFAGMYNASYFQRHLSSRPDLIDKIGAFQVMLDNEKDFIATRVAHKLNLTGPAISVHTACSTSLVAVCQAMDSLRLGYCDMALAGGVTVTCPPRSGYLHQEGAMLSPDGHTRTFDAEAGGTVFSDGAAIVLLKRLPDALADGDPIAAVILAGAVNNDGGGKASFTAPSSEGQAAVIAMAQEQAGVDARSISYVEAHGTATPVGDPIEIEGLNKAFRRHTHDRGFCRIGSVKSNVGHLVIAAGAAGLIKTALSLAEKRIPGTVHYRTPNPGIDFAGSPFVVDAQLSDWPATDTPRRAGVSSFGVGGTNAHVVLEEAPEHRQSDPATAPQLLHLSARTPEALAKAASRLADHLALNPTVNLADVAWTLARGRKSFPHRLAVVAEDPAGATSKLRSAEVATTAARSQPARHREVVFLFPGQGATYPGMGRTLYDTEPDFRLVFEECLSLASEVTNIDLRERVFSIDPGALLPTSIMQPAIFAIEYALARFWMGRGVRPAAMVGHSIGEFVAATLSGVFELPDAIGLVAHRGRLMQAQPPGGMLSVRLGIEALAPRLPPDLSIAAENAAGSCVVSGPSPPLAAFQQSLEADGIACRMLHTSHAFHSQMMDPVLAPFREAVGRVALHPPAIPIVSTKTGAWLDEEEATSPDYWTAHLRDPVRFATAIARLADSTSRLLLEAGPRATLCALARQHPDLRRSTVEIVPSLADSPDTEPAAIRMAAGQLWMHGVDIDTASFDQRTRRNRVRLPTYPFEQQRYWVDATPVQHVALATHSPEPRVQALPAAKDTPEPATTCNDHRTRLLAQLTDLFADISGFDLTTADSRANFMELGLDSLMLTQAALQIQRKFQAKVTFRQLMGDYASLDRLVALLESQLPPQPAIAPNLQRAPTLTRPLEALPVRAHPGAAMDMANPVVHAARLGRDPNGMPAWYVADPQRPGKFLKVGT